MKKHWYDYLWIYSIIYLTLGFFNILFAWIGLICFMLPLLMAICGGGKFFCNKLCDRGQLLAVLGKTCHLSANRRPPVFLHKKWFRYGFLIFFLVMFCQMLWTTYLVASGQELHELVKLLWTVKLPWHWAYNDSAAPWVAQFAFGFYSTMLTSTIIGLIVMALFRPRTWCVFCPMGTMTQLICKIKK